MSGLVLLWLSKFSKQIMFLFLFLFLPNKMDQHTELHAEHLVPQKTWKTNSIEAFFFSAGNHITWQTFHLKNRTLLSPFGTMSYVLVLFAL